jgi:hypothetical protein
MKESEKIILETTGKKRKKTPNILSEHEQQKMLFRWANFHPMLKLMFAIPNGTRTTPWIARRMKEEGLKAGVPDIFLPIPVYPWHGLFIELKRADGGTVRPIQKAWLKALGELDYHCCIANGFEEAKTIIINYIEGKT